MLPFPIFFNKRPFSRRGRSFEGGRLNKGAFVDKFYILGGHSFHGGVQ